MSEAQDFLSEGPDGDQPMSFFDHLAELRDRLLRSALGLLVGVGISWFFLDQLRAMLKLPLANAWVELELAGQPRLQVIGVLDAFLTDIRIVVTAGLFVGAPIIAYQLWMFVSPGLYRREKKYATPFMFASAMMFTLGAAFCYYLVLPYATEWFLGYPIGQNDSSGVDVLPQYTFPDYIKYTTKLLLGFGAMFEFPLVITFMALAGVVTHRSLLRFWKVSVLIICVMAAFLTPPDPLTLVLMAGPMIVLFFATVGVAYLFSRSHREAEAELGLDEELDEPGEDPEPDTPDEPS